MSASWVTTMIVTPCSRLSELQRLHDLVRRARVEIAGRLVGEQQARLIDQRARDRDPLLLTARELARRVALAIAEAEQLQRRACPLERATPRHAPDRTSRRTAATRRSRSRWCAAAD